MELALRKITDADLDSIRILAYESEAYWGFSDDHMQGFQEKYSINLDLINNSLGYVLENSNRALGIFFIVERINYFELELFYVSKNMIGKGIGKILWKYMIKICKENNITRIIIICSEVVKEYYLKMGAIELEKIESIIDKGVIVNKMEYRL